MSIVIRMNKKKRNWGGSGRMRGQRGMRQVKGVRRERGEKK